MGKNKFAWIAALAVFGTVHLSASAADRKAVASVPLYAAMEVGIAADGGVTKVEPDAALPQSLRDLLIARVSQWWFEPPQWQGKPVSTSTYLLLRLQAVPDASGGSALRILFREYEKGDRFKYGLPTQKYPLKAARKKVGGDFVYAVRIGKDGAPIDVERKVPKDLNDEYMESMDEESQSSIMRAHWRPFLADGLPVECTFVYPVSFSVNEQPTPVPDATEVRAMPDLCPTGELRTKIENTML